VEVTELYCGPLAEFVPRRNALARTLRSSDVAAAAAVGKLRKPSVSAWAIDQLAAEDPSLVAELLAAGADARDAQGGVAEGSATGEDLREAMERVRQALDAAARAAGAVLERSGHTTSEQMDRRIRMTLQAAATGSAAVRTAVWRGVLDDDLDSHGFGSVDGPQPDPPELAAALASLRRASRSDGLGRPARARRSSDLAAHRAARAAAVLAEAAQRARMTATTARERASQLADAARGAEAEATVAERAAEAAEDAARAARP